MAQHLPQPFLEVMVQEWTNWDVMTMAVNIAGFSKVSATDLLGTRQMS